MNKKILTLIAILSTIAIWWCELLQESNTNNSNTNRTSWIDNNNSNTSNNDKSNNVENWNIEESEQNSDSNNNENNNNVEEETNNNNVEENTTDNNINRNNIAYSDYSQELFNESIDSNNSTVLFFYADWCPSCKALDDNINNNYSMIPNNVDILRVNYDNEEQLKNEYWITSQHTLVFFNENWDQIDKNNTTFKLSDILETFNIDNENMETNYEAYSEEKMNSLLSKWKNVALFFHADWCPTCKALDKDINENISEIPENTVILKANYDTEKDLIEKYWITSQSTVVFLDNEWNKVSSKMWLIKISKILE